MKNRQDYTSRTAKNQRISLPLFVFLNLGITQNFVVAKNFLYSIIYGRGILQFYNESGLGKYRLFVFSLVRRMTGTAPSTSSLPSPRPSTCPGSPSSSSSDSSRKISNISVIMLSIYFKFFLQ